MTTLGDETTPSPLCGTAVDLDGDEDLEIIHGAVAYHHDGTPYYDNPEIDIGFSQVADLDLDGVPEIIVAAEDGFALLNFDGSVVYSEQQTVGEGYGWSYKRPAAIHDIAGGEEREFMASSMESFIVYNADLSQVYKRPVADYSGSSGSTAFDFLGDGTAEAIYMDEEALRIYDHQGNDIFTWSRVHDTGMEYPIVADIDNDGAAEILVISNGGWGRQLLGGLAAGWHIDRDQRRGRSVGECAPDLESARLSRHQCARRRNDPPRTDPALDHEQHLPYADPDLDRYDTDSSGLRGLAGAVFLPSGAMPEKSENSK